MGADVISIEIPMAFRKRGGRKVIVLPDGSHGHPIPTATIDNTMIKAIARAFGNGSGASVAQKLCRYCRPSRIAPSSISEKPRRVRARAM